jgi:hypothetical protein
MLRTTVGHQQALETTAPPEPDVCLHRLAAAEEGRQGQGHPLTQAGLSEILPEPSGPLSPPSSSVGGDATSLSHFLQGRWYDLLANESTGVLVNAGVTTGIIMRQGLIANFLLA